MILDEIKKANIQALKDKDTNARTIYGIVSNKAMLETIKKREKGEDDLAVAKRESAEEAGYEGKDWVYLGTIYPTPAYDSETIGLYYAKKGNYVGQHLDQDEHINVSLLTLDEITDKIIAGEVHDAKTVSMTFLIKEMKERGLIQ